LLVTEDNYFEESVQEILNENDNQLVVVNCCKDAIQYLMHDDFDLVLFDLNVKELDSLDTIQLIKYFRPQMPIISISDNASYDIGKKIAKIGVYFRLNKPVDEQITKELVKNLEKKLKGRDMIPHRES
jgi:DNA-binding NtrC family response regulator